MRPVDIAGLFAFMLLGLVGLTFWRSVADGLASMLGARRSTPIGDSLRASARVIVLAFTLFMVVGSALVALKVLEPRPGRYPGGAWTTAGAIAVLVTTGFLLVWRVVRPSLRRHRVEARDDARR